MEFIFGMILVYGGYWLFFKVLGTGAQAIGAAARTVSSGGSFADNFSNNLQFKIEQLPTSESPDLNTFGVFVKGNPEVTSPSPVVFIFKLFDKETSSPILSTFDEASEINSRVFEHTAELGDLNGKHFPDWAKVSWLLPECLIGPNRGTRQLELKCFIWEKSYKPSYKNGWLPEGGDTTGGINVINHEFTLFLPNSGYMEIDEERLKVQVASVKLAISIALADGSLDQSEGNEIKKWIKEIVESSLETEKEEIKLALNNSLDEGFKQVKEGLISIPDICNAIKAIGSKADKYDLLELCLDVMAADGEADKEELKQISMISNLIGIDYDEVTKLKDQRLIKLDPSSASNVEDLEQQLGIDPNWDNEKIKKHLVREFTKWNGRLATLPEDKRHIAQEKLDLIAQAMKKYS